jgi:ABC-2 family transporter protein
VRLVVYKIRGSHLRLIALYFARHNIRGGTGILFTLAMLFVGLGVASAFITPLEEIQRRANEDRKQFIPPGQEVPDVQKKDVMEVIIDQIGEPVAMWFTGDEDQARFLVRQRPALVSAILMVLLFVMPFLACFGSFNQLAGDIQYRGLRYLLLRTERANIFLGRFIGTALFTAVVLAILLAVLYLYLVFKADFYSPIEMALWLGQGYVALLLFGLPYIALCSWISAAMDSPLVSLVICELVTLFPIIFVAVASGIHPSLGYIGYITPWPLKYMLIHPNPLYLALSALALLGFTALFLLLGLRHFQKRDL